MESSTREDAHVLSLMFFCFLAFVFFFGVKTDFVAHVDRTDPPSLSRLADMGSVDGSEAEAVFRFRNHSPVCP